MATGTAGDVRGGLPLLAGDKDMCGGEPDADLLDTGLLFQLLV